MKGKKETLIDLQFELELRKQLVWIPKQYSQ